MKPYSVTNKGDVKLSRLPCVPYHQCSDSEGGYYVLTYRVKEDKHTLSKVPKWHNNDSYYWCIDFWNVSKNPCTPTGYSCAFVADGDTIAESVARRLLHELKTGNHIVNEKGKMHAETDRVATYCRGWVVKYGESKLVYENIVLDN
jgi:hypothetical protein